MSEEAKANERPTTEQIAAWKQKYGAVHLITFDGREAYLKKPKVADLERAMAADKKPKAKSLDFNRSILANCTLYIDPDFREDDERELALLSAVGEAVQIREAEVKKL